MAIQLKRSLTPEIDQAYVLLPGQVGIEMPTAQNTSSQPFKVKIGDGSTSWSALPYFGDNLRVDTSSFVPATRRVNNKALSADISLTANDVGAASASHVHNNYVPNTRTVNSKALSSNISLTYSDVGAAAADHTHDTTSTTVWKLASEYGILPNDNSAAQKINSIGPMTGENGVAFPEGTYIISEEATFDIPVYAAPGVVFQIGANVRLYFNSTFESSGTAIFVMASGGTPMFNQSTVELTWFSNAREAIVICKNQHLNIHCNANTYPYFAQDDMVTNGQYLSIIGDESGPDYRPTASGKVTVNLPNTGDAATIILKNVNIMLSPSGPFITTNGNFNATFNIKLINVTLLGTGSLINVSYSSGGLRPKLYFENVTGSINTSIFSSDSNGAYSFYWHNYLNTPKIAWQTGQTNNMADVSWDTDFANVNLTATSNIQISFGCGTLTNCSFDSENVITTRSSGGASSGSSSGTSNIYQFRIYPNLVSNFNNRYPNLIYFNCNFKLSTFEYPTNPNNNRHKIVFLSCQQCETSYGPSGYSEGWPTWATVI